MTLPTDAPAAGQPQTGTIPATQTRHPWRATVRTGFALVVSGATLLPYVLAGAHVDNTVVGTQVLGVAAGITRVLALPAVERFLRLWAPWLSAEPPLALSTPKE